MDQNIELFLTFIEAFLYGKVISMFVMMWENHRGLAMKALVEPGIQEKERG